MLRALFRVPSWLEKAWATTELDQADTVILVSEAPREWLETLTGCETEGPQG